MTSLESIQSRLAKRLDRILASDTVHLRFSLYQAWQFLHSEPAIKSILDDLAHRLPTWHGCSSLEPGGIRNAYDSPTMNSIEKASAYSYGIWRLLNANDYQGIEEVEEAFYRLPIANDHDHEIEELRRHVRFRRHIIAMVFDYVAEQLDTQQMVFHQLLRYKTRCEVFAYEMLAAQIEAHLAPQPKQERLEKVLQADLYRYLHDEGIEFSIEPKFTEDMIDVIASLKKEDSPILIETKVFKTRKREAIQKGYNQIVTYARTYSQRIGYLAIYNLEPYHLVLDLENFQKFFFFKYNDVTIYFLVINVPRERTAAHDKGKFEAFVITRDDLITALSDTGAAS